MGGPGVKRAAGLLEGLGARTVGEPLQDAKDASARATQLSGQRASDQFVRLGVTGHTPSQEPPSPPRSKPTPSHNQRTSAPLIGLILRLTDSRIEVSCPAVRRTAESRRRP